MTGPEWLGADDFDDIARAYNEQNDPEPERLFVDAYEFVQQIEEDPEPLLGSDNVAIIPRGGLVLLAGRPGSGKTTLVIDLALHVAAGLPWPPAASNGSRSPEAWPAPRPLRVVLIENEGPRELFRAKLADKLEQFPHDVRELGGWLGIQTWRWGAFSFADLDSHNAAAAQLEEHEIDLVIGDPLATLGPEGVGSPEDTRRFVALLRPLGLGTRRSFLFLHHFRERVENQQDELARVSGAWGGHLDTLLALTAMHSTDQVRLSYPKLRWSRVQPPRPIVLGRVWEKQAFEALAEEGDKSLLEPTIYEWLSDARDGERQGWSTESEIAKGLERRRADIRDALAGATHLFCCAEGEQAKALGARTKLARLWGLHEWVDAPRPAATWATVEEVTLEMQRDGPVMLKDVLEEIERRGYNMGGIESEDPF